ncbi:MAG: DUF3237 domain-containing protein [Actinomycetes bacterium]
MSSAHPSPPVPPVKNKVFTLDVLLREPIILSGSDLGRRTFIPIMGGSVSGSRLDATIIDGGGDWALERADGGMNIHAHYLIRADDEEVIEVDNVGRWRERADGSTYFVTTPVFVVGDGRHAWLRETVFVGMGQEVDERRIVIDVYAVGVEGS